MDEHDFLTDQFEANRARLRGVAYRMLGSTTEADDAVQEAWLRLSRTEADEVENLAAWLTTVVARICLNVLRARTSHREDLAGDLFPDPVVTLEEHVGPEQQALLADSVGLALLVVLETLNPAERLAFVLHDMFAVPFDEIAPVVGRTPEATRQLASRARRRVQGAPVQPDTDLPRQRAVVDAFFAAARGGDFEALVAVLDPDVVLRTGSLVVHGATEVAGRALMFASPGRVTHPVLVNGAAGVLVTVGDRRVSLMAFTVVGGAVAAIDALTDADRLAALEIVGA